MRVGFPDTPEDFRYGRAGGAPVVVIAPGGWAAGDLNFSEEPGFLEAGMIYLSFFFPGGGAPGAGSEGIYDERGELCQLALRDVLRFAAGEITDFEDRDLSLIVGGRAREDLVGILALSNGGSIAVATLGRHGDEIPPLAFLVGWESPTNDQILGGELGTHDLDPDGARDSDGDGILDNDVVNGAYLAYGFPQLNIDYTPMRFDPSAQIFSHGHPVGAGLFYFDNDGDGIYTESPTHPGSPDADDSGIVDADEDFPLYGLSHTDSSDQRDYRMLSRAAANHAQTAALVDPWPEDYATPTMSRDYWEVRDATEHFVAAMAEQPTLAGMTLFTTRDHVQTDKGHAHVHHWASGFLGAGHWYRLNPDRSYVEAIGHNTYPEARDNDANLNPAAENFDDYSQSMGAVERRVLMLAGVTEMADRSAFGVWDDNLDATINDAPENENPAHIVTFVINCHDWVNPLKSADTINFVLDTLEAIGARAELYLTAPLVEAWLDSAPDLIERLKQGNHTISYHVRPPHPVAFEPTQPMLEDYALADFEKYHQDLATGEIDETRPGGYTFVSETLGLIPYATGIAAQNAQLGRRFARITGAFGSRMGTFDHGPADEIGGYENLALPEEGLYPRPNDYYLARVDAQGLPSKGNFWWNRIASGEMSPEELAESYQRNFLNMAPEEEGQPLFSVVVIHENNFYMDGTPWRPVYYEDPESRFPKSPPWDLDATAPWVSPRSPEEIQRIRLAFEALVQCVASDDDTTILTSTEIAEIGDEFFQPSSDPRVTTNWAQAGNLETSPPEGYDWFEMDGSGSFRIDSASAETGNGGLRMETSADYEIARRVDIDKGTEYSFKASIRGNDIGSVHLILQPVQMTPSGIVPVSREIFSPELSGDFDWSRLEGTTLMLSNCDYVLLKIRIEGGGSLDVDNLAVSSSEHRAMVIPESTAAPVLVGTLIHVEDVEQLTSDSDYYRAKHQLLEDLGRIFHEHGAILTIQPEIELLDGIQSLDPSFLAHLRQDYGCGFSVHTHGPKGADPSLVEVLEYVAERKGILERLGAGSVYDLNGNFDVDDYGVFSRIGVYSMTAFKNTRTQSGYEGRYFHPWRPSPGNPITDEDAWAVDDPTSRVIYLPGGTSTTTRYADRLEEKVLPELNASLWNTEEARPTTWYFVTHVDFFSSAQGDNLEEYMESEDYRRALDAYGEMLSSIFDPLVDRGLIRWATPNDMREAFEESEGIPHPWGAPSDEPREAVGRVPSD